MILTRDLVWPQNVYSGGMEINLVNTGPIARIGHKCIVVSDPDIILKISEVQISGHCSESKQREIINQVQQDMEIMIRHWRALMKEIGQSSSRDGLQGRLIQKNSEISEPKGHTEM